jgi:hypothetical protein
VTSSFLYPIGVTVSVITTLTTPYLIKSSDRALVGLDRHAPHSWLRLLDRYTAWAQRHRREAPELEPSRPPLAPETARLPAILREATLLTLAVPAGADACGKRLRELALRSTTGATVVGIGRGAESIVNPDPDEELQGADEVLLIGSGPQLAAARALLTAKAEPA